jgi:ribosome-associated heat shock protein Hsp15
LSRRAAKISYQDGDHQSACRLDIWLFRTRLLKTRSLAARLITKGKIRVRRNGRTDRVQKPHTLIRPGDQITFMRGQELISVEMVEPGERRGPASEAQRLYIRLEETELSR